MSLFLDPTAKDCFERIITSFSVYPITTSSAGLHISDHAVSVVGWGTDATAGLYWIARNSWGEYWGEQGYVRVKSGALALEQSCAWATVKDFTAPEKGNQFHCYEDGSNCN